jgi:hypothetical protein
LEVLAKQLALRGGSDGYSRLRRTSVQKFVSAMPAGDPAAQLLMERLEGKY